MHEAICRQPYRFRIGIRGLEVDGRRKAQANGKDRHRGMGATANAKSIVDRGSPVGKTRRISARGIADTRNALGARGTRRLGTTLIRDSGSDLGTD